MDTNEQMTEGENILTAAALHKSLGAGPARVHVLRGLDLTIRRGEFLAVMGPSGCGKSTLLHVLGLMMPPTEAAALRLDGEDVLGLREPALTGLRREKIGFVFQRFNLLGTITAAENVRLALRIRGTSVDGRVEEVFGRLGLTGLEKSRPGELSFGEQQRVAIARAVACRPKLLLADEPTGNLDTANAQQVMTLLREVHAETGVTTIMITHNPQLGDFADRVLRMRDGRFQ